MIDGPNHISSGEFSSPWIDPKKKKKSNSEIFIKVINAPGAWIDRSKVGSWERVAKVAAIGLGALALGCLLSYLYVKSSGLAKGNISLTTFPFLVIIVGVGAAGLGLIIRECLKGASAQFQSAFIKYLNHLAHLAILGLVITMLTFQFQHGFVEGMSLTGITVITVSIYGIIFLANYIDKLLDNPEQHGTNTKKAYIV